MADAVKALTHWRQRRDIVRSEHTREVVKRELDDGAKQALLMMAERIERLERIIAALALEARRDV